MKAVATLAGFMKKHLRGLSGTSGVPLRMLRSLEPIVFGQHGVEPLFTR